MGNGVSLINGCYFYALEKQPIEAFLDHLLRVGIMLFFSIKIDQQYLLSYGFVFTYDRKLRKS